MYLRLGRHIRVMTVGNLLRKNIWGEYGSLHLTTKKYNLMVYSPLDLEREFHLERRRTGTGWTLWTPFFSLQRVRRMPSKMTWTEYLVNVVNRRLIGYDNVEEALVGNPVSPYQCIVKGKREGKHLSVETTTTETYVLFWDYSVVGLKLGKLKITIAASYGKEAIALGLDNGVIVNGNKEAVTLEYGDRTWKLFQHGC